MRNNTYKYKNKVGNEIIVEITDDIMNSSINEALNNYELSKKIIHSEYYFIWRWALKAYHLSTIDRRNEAKLKDWQSNIAFGLIRSFVDVFISTLTENPVVFTAKGITELGITNAPNVQHALATTADVTDFQ